MPFSVFLPRRRGLAALAALLLLSLTLSPRLATPRVLAAATCTWLGATGSWAEPTSWSCLAVPGPGDSAIVASGTVQVDDGRSVGSLTLTGGALLITGALTVTTSTSWSGGAVTGASPTVSGTLTLQGSSSLSGSLAKTLDGRVANAGTLVWDGGDMLGAGLLTNLAGRTLSINGTGSFAPTLDSRGSVSKQSAGVTTFARWRSSGGGAALEITGGTLRLASGTAATQQLLAMIYPGTTLEFTGGSFSYSSAALYGSLFTPQFVQGVPGTLRFSGGSVSIASGNVGYAGQLLIDGGALSVAQGFLAAEDLVIQSGSLTMGSGELQIGSSRPQAYGRFTNSASFNPGTSTVRAVGSKGNELVLNVPTPFYRILVPESRVLTETVSADNATVSGWVVVEGTLAKLKSIGAPGLYTLGLTGAALDVATSGTLSALVVTRTDHPHPSAGPQISLRRSYGLAATGTGYSAAVALPFKDGDPTDSVCRYSGAGISWDCGYAGATATMIAGPPVGELNGAWAVASGETADVPPYTVNSTVDDGMLDVDGVCSQSHCSLAEAIDTANVTQGILDTIAFSLAPSDPGYAAADGTWTISSTLSLPALRDATLLDGATQAGASCAWPATPRVVLRSAPRVGNLPYHTLLRVQGSGGSTVRGLVFGAAADAAIQLDSNNNQVACSMVGTDASGELKASSFAGIRVNGGYNVVGTDGDGQDDALERNLISGATAYGVLLEGSDNRVAGNYIGTNISGTLQLPNATGVAVFGSRNVVGTDGDGQSDVLERNLISGNSTQGIVVGFTSRPLAVGNRVAGNYLGTTPDGMLPLLNSFRGLIVANASGTLIGTDGDGSPGDTLEGNVIARSPAASITLQTSATTATVIAGNMIGVAADGVTPLYRESALYYVASPLAKWTGGIWISALEGAPNNTTVGGDLEVERNVIAYHNNSAIRVAGGTGHRIMNNVIHHNKGLAIDLNASETSYGFNPDPNDASDSDLGANKSQNYPVISSVVVGTASTTVTAVLTSTPNTTFDVELYQNSSYNINALCEAEQRLGNAVVTTNGAGRASFDMVVPRLVARPRQLTMSATDPAGNTSELSPCVVPHQVRLPLMALRKLLLLATIIDQAMPQELTDDRGYTFYSTTINVPARLPEGGTFYLSSSPDSLGKTLVDDAIVIKLGANTIFQHTYSVSGPPVEKLIEVPRSVVEQMAGKPAKVELRDVRGYAVETSRIYLVWVES